MKQYLGSSCCPSTAALPVSHSPDTFLPSSPPCRDQFPQKPQQPLAQSPTDNLSCLQLPSLLTLPSSTCCNPPGATAHDFNEESLCFPARSGSAKSNCPVSTASQTLLPKKAALSTGHRTLNTAHAWLEHWGAQGSTPTPWTMLCTLCYQHHPQQPCSDPREGHRACLTREKETVGRESSHTEESITGHDVFRAGRACVFKII